MENDNIDIELLLIKYFNQEINSDEVTRLKIWLEKNIENQSYFSRISNLWNITHPAFPIKDINTNEALRKVLCKIASSETKVLHTSRPFIYYWQRIAAVLLIPLILGIAYLLLIHNNTIPITYQETSTPYGTLSQITLADGSKVWLNSGSCLKYPMAFTGNERVVHLSGEGYFQVRSDKSHPFIVKTPDISVKATGTAFNVCAYKNDSIVSVVLAHGKVYTNMDMINKQAFLYPNQKIDYNTISHKYTVHDCNTYQWCSWKDGIMMFKDVTLEYIFKRLGQLYNIDFEIADPSLKSQVYWATFQGEPLDEILQLLQISAPIQCTKISQRNLTNPTKRKYLITKRAVN
jgi:transmembrane sensor